MGIVRIAGAEVNPFFFVFFACGACEKSFAGVFSAACEAGGEQYGNGRSTRRDCLERSDGTFFRSTTERMEKQILSFDRLRTGALLRMTKRESGRGTEGKDPGSSITNVEDDRREKQILSFDRLRTGALLRIVNVQSFVDNFYLFLPLLCKGTYIQS